MKTFTHHFFIMPGLLLLFFTPKIQAQEYQGFTMDINPCSEMNSIYVKSELQMEIEHFVCIFKTLKKKESNTESKDDSNFSKLKLWNNYNKELLFLTLLNIIINKHITFVETNSNNLILTIRFEQKLDEYSLIHICGDIIKTTFDFSRTLVSITEM